MRNLILRAFLLSAVVSALGFSTFAQTPTLTYQGSLQNGSAPANGAYDFQFDIYSLPTGGEPRSNDGRKR